ncbi:uncharacterized protein BT62DRAFT_1029979 [Guyanagaster necrorhizus]|uniref:F-box domain-containing protein n=1 Tax=Guyanagaster necrorhizus TaxID=856835 RepID=A0A9P8AQ63_9AGAR|nr:uncharacterized protein BT62DRAFT_1029979 [Guyanagaster necrorhizus MCA 3950]KAG7444048.1 hypothetical protein BT62DRAFT_1029979 [Guyanagaster necrorhizus MCA 3950]
MHILLSQRLASLYSVRALRPSLAFLIIHWSKDMAQPQRAIDHRISIPLQNNDLCNHPRQPSAADLCPSEIIEKIISGLDKPDAASTAIVCKTWLEPSRICLYSSLQFIYPAPLLASTLRTCAAARSYIHTLSLRIVPYPLPDIPPQTPADYDWLLLLPPGNIWSFHVAFWSLGEMILPDVLRQLCATSLSALESLVISSSFIDRETINLFASLRSLREVCLSAPLTVVSNAEVPVLPPLTRLGIHAGILGDLLLSLPISSLSSTLTRFDFRLPREIRNTLFSRLPPILKEFKLLRRLTVEADLKCRSMPFMDDIIGHLPRLEYLHVCSGIWSSVLLERLPPLVTYLSLENRAIAMASPQPFPIPSILQMLDEHVGVLQTLVLQMYSQREISLEPLRRICRLSNINLIRPFLVVTEKEPRDDIPGMCSAPPSGLDAGIAGRLTRTSKSESDALISVRVASQWFQWLPVLFFFMASIDIVDPPPLQKDGDSNNKVSFFEIGI